MSNEQQGNAVTNVDIVKAAMSKAFIKGTMAGLKQNDVNTILTSLKPQIAQALPKHLTAERMCQMTTTLITQNQEIAKCSVPSIVGAVMQASILGFEPVSALGQCYFVPYGGHVQFQIGYKGYLRLAQNSKEVKNIYAEVVRSGDRFEYELGLEPKLKHVPNIDGGDAPVTHVYAVAHLVNGSYQFVVMSRKQIELLRLRNPSQKSGIKGAWATDYEAMAKGKVIKQLAKYLPLSVDVQKAIISDESIITDKAFTNTGDGINVDAITFDPFEDVSAKRQQETIIVPKVSESEPKPEPEPIKPMKPEDSFLNGPAHFLDEQPTAPPIPEPKRGRPKKIDPNIQIQSNSDNEISLFNEIDKEDEL